MKIIKEGVIPKEPVYQNTCGNCGTIFQFSRSECQENFTPVRGYSVLTIRCPLCRLSSQYVGVGLDHFEVKA